MVRSCNVILISILILALALSGCGGGKGGGPDGGGPTTYVPGQSVTYTVGGVPFSLHYVPGGLTFASDVYSITEGLTGSPYQVRVDQAYWMAETELTYELWEKVKTWATTIAPDKYTFVAGFGLMGGRFDSVTKVYEANSDGGNQQPVTHINWREVITWCNALTEYHYGNSVNCVYYSDAEYTMPLRDSSTISPTPFIKAATAGNTDMAKCIAKGFRLPTTDEWDLAARYQDGRTWTAGDHISGDTTGPCYTASGDGLSNVFADYAWYVANSNNFTHPVGLKKANALGIKDMSGNVYEWCFDVAYLEPPDIVFKVWRGGSFVYDTKELQLGWVTNLRYSYPSSMKNGNIGFRLARSE